MSRTRGRRRGATSTVADAVLARRASSPAIRPNPDLPLAAKRDEIVALLREHPVLIVAGETGSGKSTQLPQYCLQIGRGIDGMIAHTQPRRLAARALAARIAEEMSEPVGGTVGYRVRFSDRVSPGTRLVLMTDGLLLAELAADRRLQRYDTVIVDEAHERSLNVDLLLGVLKRLVAERSDLKVIITSATLEVGRIAAFFGGAPIVSAGGRGHPVEVRYVEPATEAEEPDLPAAVLQAYRTIESDPGAAANGDVLVFLPGEREIADVGDLLERELGETEVVPLYSRLSWERQSRIFQPAARRRIVLATNIAETSVTVPGIRAVVDSGLARISRYSARSRLQRLPIEKISQASAEQRKGRCGRLGPGLCIRLYGEADFAARAAFTEPEILRTNLAALLLRLAADDLGDAESFPFLDAPDTRALNDGYRLLQELGALDAERRITLHGRRMARLPLDPRLGRALLESGRFQAQAELLAIVSGLSVPDVRAGDGAEHDEEAAAAGAVKSEFLDLARTWRAYRAARERPRRELRRWCRERGLSLLRLSEWDNVHAQVAERAAELGLRPGARDASYAAIHRSLLAGFCTMVGARGEEGVYAGPRGVRFRLFPGSPLARRKPRWVMAANIVETSRIYARRVAEVDPSWIEAAAAHLVKRDYLEPDWDEAREEVVAREHTSLFGLALASRRVNYGPVAPEAARRIFAREALVHERLGRRPDWLAANDAAVRAARYLEERLRIRGLVAEAEHFVDFYDRALPRQVSSAASLEHYTRRLGAEEMTSLRLRDEDIFLRRPDPAALCEFPERAPLGDLVVRVEYRFLPGDPQDGATIALPAIAVPAVTRAGVDAAIPGFARPRIEALLRSLPKDTRRRLIPIAETAARFAAAAGPAAANRDELAAWLRAQLGLPDGAIRFDPTEVPAHLDPQLVVVDEDREIARGTDLAALRVAGADAARAALDRAAAMAYPQAWQRFEVEELAASERLDLADGSLVVHPALDGRSDPVRVRFDWSAGEAERRHGGGALRLARDLLDGQARDLARRVAGDARLVLAASAFVDGEALVDGLVGAAFRRACFGDGAAPRRRDDFERALERGRAELHAAIDALRAEAGEWFATARAVRRRLEPLRHGACAALAREADAHLQRLLRKALAGPPAPWSGQIPRYLRAAERRTLRLADRGAEAPQVGSELAAWARRLDALGAAVAAERRWLPALDELGWWIEEYRVSLCAQELRTLGPVSAARLEARAAEIELWLRR